MPLFRSAYCPECDCEMEDVNDGHFFLRFGPPEFECVNPDCPKNPNYTEPTEEEQSEPDSD